MLPRPRDMGALKHMSLHFFYLCALCELLLVALSCFELHWSHSSDLKQVLWHYDVGLSENIKKLAALCCWIYSAAS